MLAVTAAAIDPDDPLRGLVVGDRPEPEPPAGWTRVAVKAENQKATHPITILADKDIPYRVLKKVMVTCAAANFGDVSFGLRRKEGKAEA